MELRRRKMREVDRIVAEIVPVIKPIQSRIPSWQPAVVYAVARLAAGRLDATSIAALAQQLDGLLAEMETMDAAFRVSVSALSPSAQKHSRLSDVEKAMAALLAKTVELRQRLPR